MDRLNAWMLEFQSLWMESFERLDYLFGYSYLLQRKEEYRVAERFFRQQAEESRKKADSLKTILSRGHLERWHPVQQAQLKGLCSELQGFCEGAGEVCERVWRARAFGEQYSKKDSSGIRVGDGSRVEVESAEMEEDGIAEAGSAAEAGAGGVRSRPPASFRVGTG